MRKDVILGTALAVFLAFVAVQLVMIGNRLKRIEDSNIAIMYKLDDIRAQQNPLTRDPD